MLEGQGIRATFAVSALDVLGDRELPAFLGAHGHEVAFAGYTDADTTRLPEPLWTAEATLGQRIVERGAEREIRVYVATPLLAANLDSSAVETARRATLPLRSHLGLVKIGLELFVGAGPSALSWARS